jgi:hypothetical protein
MFSAKGLVSLLALAATTLAANSFAGSNLYYAAGLSSAQQNTLFQGMQSGESSLHILIHRQLLTITI